MGRAAAKAGALAAALLALAGDPGRAAPAPVDLEQSLSRAVPTAAARAAARAAGLDLASRPGTGGADSVTALVCLGPMGGPASRQWVVRFRMAQAAGAKSSSGTFYTTAGDVFTFPSARAAMDVRIVGPVPTGDGGGPAALEDERVLVSSDFLRLDLTRAARVLQRMHGAGKPPGLHLTVAPEPERNADAPSVRAAFERLGIGEGDRRSFAGALPALAEFFTAAERTPGLSDILFRVVRMPSLFTVLRHGGEPGLSVRFIGGGAAGEKAAFWRGGRDPSLCTLSFVVEAFGGPVLDVVLYAVPPAPPYEATAGIVGAAAYSPGARDKVLVMRVLLASPAVPLEGD
ncbi:MAG TPA: hypothetical protein VGG34_08165 [Opitutaceae bacterium]|jgi:hypothetical protein